MKADESTEQNVYERRKARALARMNEALRAEYEALGSKLTAAEVSDARARYDIGVVVRRVSDAGTYGANAVKLLSTALGYDKTSLYDAARVVTCWSRKAFEDILQKPTLHRRPLSFSHFALLVRVTNEAKRNEYLATTLKLGLPVRELARLIEGRKARSQGRHPSRVAKALISQANAGVKWLDSLEPKAAATPETRQLLEEATRAHRELLKRLEAALNGYEKGAKSKGLNQAKPQDESETFRTSGKSPSILWGEARR
jgi:hypothetical protein